MNLWKLAAVAVVALGVSPAFAQVSNDPSKAVSGLYNADPLHTQVLFDVNHLGTTMFYGKFVGPTGTLNFVSAAPETSSVDITIKTASVNVDIDKLNEELRGDHWLDAAKYPTITFKSTKVVKTGPTTGTMTGDFTLHGVTKPLTLDVVFNAGGMSMQKKAVLGFQASGKLKRSDYGVMAGLPNIGDEVSIIISGSFIKAD